MTEKNWVFFRGTNRIRDDELFQLHGLRFEKGKIYPVSVAVAEYLKKIIGFEVCKGIGSKEVVDFPKKKKEYTTQSYRDSHDTGK